MLIKKENDNRLENEHVKFVSYTGSYPNLCRGTLTLIIDNEKCVFTGYETDEKNNKYPRFWESGGSGWFDNDWNDYCNEGEWEIYEDKIPKKYRGYAKDIDFIFNTNVKHGCCGGCL